MVEENNNPTLEAIANTMRVHLTGPASVQLEFPVRLDLRLEDDLRHVEDVVEVINASGVLYMARALWTYAQALAPIVDHLPEFNHGDEEPSAAKEVEAEIVE